MLNHTVNLNVGPEPAADVETAKNAKAPFLGNSKIYSAI